MTLPTSGAISMQAINAEFGRGLNLNAYRGTSWFKDDNTSGTFPTGAISLTDFYGKRLTAPVTPVTNQYDWASVTSTVHYTIPNYNSLKITCKSPAGADATGCAGTFGGGNGGLITYTYVKGVAGSPAVGADLTIYRQSDGLCQALFDANNYMQSSPGTPADGGVSGGGGRFPITCTGGGAGASGNGVRLQAGSTVQSTFGGNTDYAGFIKVEIT